MSSKFKVPARGEARQRRQSSKLELVYWLIPIALFIIQAVFTFNSMHQIRYEELAESVRNVWWLQQRTVYDGISSNVGFYAPLLVTYNLFGFSLFTAKFFRLALHFVSLVCLAAILRQFFSSKYASFALVTIALSPTMLYFNTIQTQYGIDLQYFPIVAYLLMQGNLLVVSAGWAIAMIALMSYPTFLFYLPALVVLFLRHKRRSVQHIGMSIATFLAPLLALFLFVRDRQLLLFDPVNKGGIFRGGGQIMFNRDIFAKSIEGLFSDLFVHSSSYYFEVAKVEFSDSYAIASVALVLALSAYLFLKTKKYRLVVGLAFLTMVVSILVYGVSFDPSLAPGIRRATAVLTSFYALFTISLYFVVKEKFSKTIRWGMIGALTLLPLHHVIVFSFNLDYLRRPSIYREGSWFALKKTPSESLDFMLQAVVKEDLRLGCQSREGQVVGCRLSEVYAAVAGSCQWNRLACKNIQALDPKSGKLIPLSTKLWEEYYFEH